MAKAFQKIYTQITAITKATCSLKAEGVGNDELATVNGKLAQVVKIIGDDVTLQVFQGTEGIPTNAEVVFLGMLILKKVLLILHVLDSGWQLLLMKKSLSHFQILIIKLCRETVFWNAMMELI